MVKYVLAKDESGVRFSLSAHKIDMKLLNFPELRQTFEYDCGPNALQSVLFYYDIEMREEILMKKAKTEPIHGTYISSIIEIIKDVSLEYDSSEMNIEIISNYINKNIPIMLLLQAWNGKKINYENIYADGHWVVAIGYDSEKIYFEDPYSFKRTFLRYSELEARWHGEEYGKKIKKWGIAIFGKESNYNSETIIHMD